MNYTVWKADAVAFTGNNGPTYLTTYATPLAWFAYGLQPWHLLAALVFSAILHPFTTAVISATIYFLVWILVRRMSFFQRLFHWSTRASFIAVVIVTLPYIALLAYTLYTERTYVSPPSGG